jgi:hypothetical protein
VARSRARLGSIARRYAVPDCVVLVVLEEGAMHNHVEAMTNPCTYELAVDALCPLEVSSAEVAKPADCVHDIIEIERQRLGLQHVGDSQAQPQTVLLPEAIGPTIATRSPTSHSLAGRPAGTLVRSAQPSGISCAAGGAGAARVSKGRP